MSNKLFESDVISQETRMRELRGASKITCPCCDEAYIPQRWPEAPDRITVYCDAILEHFDQDCPNCKRHSVKTYTFIQGEIPNWRAVRRKHLNKLPPHLVEVHDSPYPPMVFEMVLARRQHLMPDKSLSNFAWFVLTIIGVALGQLLVWWLS